MRTPSRRHTVIGLVVVGALAVAGCQGEGTETAATSAVTPHPLATSEDAAPATETAPTTDAPATTAAQSTDDEAEGTSSAPVAATTEADEDETEGDEDTGSAPGDVIVISDVTAFTTPAQAAYCLISGPEGGMAASISCEVMQSSVPPDEELMGACDPQGFGWFFNFFEDTGHGGFFCNHVDGITRGGGNPHYWRDDPWINPESIAVLENGTRVAILDYGRVMRAGGMSCSVQPDGLTCNNPDTGHGFTVNTGSYVSW